MKRKILLVEDEKPHARLILRVFEESEVGYKLYCVDTIRKALNYLRKNKEEVCLIIADHYLPDGDGLTLIEKGKEIGVPVIILTSYGSERLAVKSLKMGAMDYVTKSIGEIYRLPQVAERALENWNAIVKREKIEKELKKYEDAFYNLLENIGDFAYILDNELRYVYANKSARDRLEVDRNEIIGREFGEFHSQEDVKIFKGKAKKVFKTGKALKYDFYDKTRDIFLFRELVPIKDPATKKIVHVLVVSKDIKAQKRAKYELKKMEKTENELSKRIKQLEWLKGGIISNVSHELKTPIAIVKSSIELALKEKDRKEEEKFLRIALKAVDRQLNIVNKLMRIAEIETSKFRISPKKIDLEELISSAIEEIYPLALTKKIHIKKSFKGNLIVRADEEKIYEVLINLLENAIKYNKENGKIYVNAESKEDYVEISIRDIGIGIKTENLRKIFDKFFQEKPSARESKGGIGLGLTIVKEIVEAHGGVIWVESKVGRGSKFTFTIPKLPDVGVVSSYRFFTN
ncbi:MAG: hypothetical protein DRN88_05050 [Candidatus Hydrothermarchaeota archaeon]|nr:MAG: hypothetical protein DRN88_05050 [Candidatus Hydrothermarchaeota archaeon]